jgi:hypothetical protein
MKDQSGQVSLKVRLNPDFLRLITSFAEESGKAFGLKLLTSAVPAEPTRRSRSMRQTADTMSSLSFPLRPRISTQGPSI